MSDSALVVRDEDYLFEIVFHRATEDLSLFGLLEFVRFEFLSDDCMKRAVDFISSSLESLTFGIWSSLRLRLTLPVVPVAAPGRFNPLPAIDSKIISVAPELFSIFHESTFQLLYRGSRDGFGGPTLHSRCNGHPNTVTLISSTNNCVFGAYTPIAWGSSERFVPDPDLASFIFTIKNPHNLPPRIFKQKEQAHAVFHSRAWGAIFGNGYDLSLCAQCRSETQSGSRLGNAYPDTLPRVCRYPTPGMSTIQEFQVLTGSANFSVNEIEVFQLVSLE
jgi:hypothetical protein